METFEAHSQSATNDLPFYFTLYGDAHGATASAQLLRNGRAIAEAPIELTAETNRSRAAARTPADRRVAGRHVQLRIKVAQGAREVSRSAFFTLAE